MASLQQQLPCLPPLFSLTKLMPLRLQGMQQGTGAPAGTRQLQGVAAAQLGRLLRVC